MELSDNVYREINQFLYTNKKYNMDKTHIPQSNAKEKIEKDCYNNLLSKVKISIHEKQPMKCIFQKMHIDYKSGINQQLKHKYWPNCIFDINAKLTCKSSNCTFAPKVDGYLQQCENCNEQAFLNITVRNEGEAVKIKMCLAAEKQDLQLIKMFDFEKHLKKNEKFQKDWQIVAAKNNGTRLYGKDYTKHFSGDLFSSSGNLILVCDLKVTKENDVGSESRFPGNFAMLANWFSDANVNPPSPPDQLTDVVLCVEKNKIYCHKMILAISSKVFERMFLSDMKESRCSEIKLKDVDLQTIKSIISFMYKNKIENHEINVEVLAAADKYELLRLKDICSTRLAKTINNANVSKIWHCAYLHDVEELSHAALIYMLENWESLAKLDDIRDLCAKYPKLVFTISTLMAESRKDDSE